MAASAPADLLLDHGVLLDRPCAEWGGTVAVRRCGGHAVLPWRGEYAAAVAAGLAAVASAPELPGPVAQAVVHVEKSRPGTWSALAAAWAALAAGGRLLVVGGNELGITTTGRRLAAQLGQEPELVANRARARVLAFVRDGGDGPEEPPVDPLQLDLDGGFLELRSAPGVFSAERLDPGSALLLEHLGRLGAPERVVDLGAGLGALGLAAARRWRACTVDLLEADHRAVVCARANAVAVAGERASVEWWDAERDPPPAAADAVVCNPPFHRGRAVDYGPARAMFAAIAVCLRPGGRALVVANRQLPYEAELRALGRLEEVALRAGFKLLLVTRASP